MEKSNDIKNCEDSFQSLRVSSSSFAGMQKELPAVEKKAIQKCDRSLKNKMYGLCKFYLKHGFCKYGKNCNFSHSVNNSSACNNHTEKYLPHNNEFNNWTGIIKFEDCSKVPSLCENRNPHQSHMKSNLFRETGVDPRGDIGPYDHNIDLCNDQLRSAKSYTIPGKSYKDANKISKRSIAVCYYYKRGFCFKSDSCKFLHPRKYSAENPETIITHNYVDKTDFFPEAKVSNDVVKGSELNNSELKKSSINISGSVTFPVGNVRNVYELSSLSQDHLFMLRDTEIKQLKKRFPSHDVVEENKVYAFCFEPSDPDWPFDIKNLNIEITLPENYPIEVCIISVMPHDEAIPFLLIKYLNTSIREWLNKTHKAAASNENVLLIFRPFLKWFDRSLEELFICGLRQVKQDIKAKESGIEFVPHETLFSGEQHDTSNSLTQTENGLSSEHTAVSQLELKTNKFASCMKETLACDEKVKHIASTECMKIILSNLELTEGAAALNCMKISVTLQCSRCKTTLNAKSEQKRSCSYKCLKCNKNIGFTFDPFTVHQFSNVLGNFYLMDCLPVDVNLQECQFLIDCLNCSKQVAVEGVHYGQKHKTWCMFCNQKLIISVESVKFQAAKLTSYTVDIKYVPAKKISKRSKDPVLREGEALPNFGTCKHYKKSYRWLRFPCCGRLYPCDECHNEKENDHEMKFASRMICGFCSKEQPYSREKPCFSCSKNVTKKSGSHWEGGKGCRNKMQMCREDKQKYAGTCKTLSKKAQNCKSGKKA